MFAGGFMSVHVGDIPVEAVSQQLYDYLQGFNEIVETYQRWKDVKVGLDIVKEVFESEGVPEKHTKAILSSLQGTPCVYDAYNSATDYATHKMKTFHTAFELLTKINHGFQGRFGTGYYE